MAKVIPHRTDIASIPSKLGNIETPLLVSIITANVVVKDVWSCYTQKYHMLSCDLYRLSTCIIPLSSRKFIEGRVGICGKLSLDFLQHPRSSDHHNLYEDTPRTVTSSVGSPNAQRTLSFLYVSPFLLNPH